MSISKGKQFENKFFNDLKSCFGENCFVIRIPDQMSGYKKTSRNLCDFILFVYEKLYIIECKSHKGNTFPWSELRQYDDLLKVAGINGLRSGVVLWMIDHSLVVYLPIKTIEKMKKDGKKSFNVKDLEKNKYRVIVIPSVKKRIFMDSDYKILTTLKEGD